MLRKNGQSRLEKAYRSSHRRLARATLTALLAGVWADSVLAAAPAELTVEPGRQAALRIAVEEGLFFLHEAPPSHTRGRGTEHLALWYDAATSSLYLYGRLIRTDADVSVALLALNEQLGPYLDSLIQAAPEVMNPQSSVVGGAGAAGSTRWSPATLRALNSLLAEDKMRQGAEPGGTDPSDSNVADVQIV